MNGLSKVNSLFLTSQNDQLSKIVLSLAVFANSATESGFSFQAFKFEPVVG